LGEEKKKERGKVKLEERKETRKQMKFMRVCDGSIERESGFRGPQTVPLASSSDPFLLFLLLSL
jgi:hypothetical protein